MIPIKNQVNATLVLKMFPFQRSNLDNKNDSEGIGHSFSTISEYPNQVKSENQIPKMYGQLPQAMHDEHNYELFSSTLSVITFTEIPTPISDRKLDFCLKNY